MTNLPRLRAALMTAALPTLFLGVCCQSLYAADRMERGQWEFSMTTDGSTRTMTQCVTADKASEVNGDTQSARSNAEKHSNGQCKIKSFEVAGDKVSYSLACGARQIDSVTTFHGDSSEGTLVTTSDGNSVTTQVKARRLGACP
jgi:Protein of unknown function (DUF3617)